MSYVTMLNEAKQALSDILAGRSEAVRALNYEQRMLRVKDLRETIDWLEQMAALESGHCAVRPIRSVRV